jgi:glutamate formiminotransferase/formiminotetrahydrofolate cyclodeaminase
MALVECVPNVSEGRLAATLDALSAMLRAFDGVRLLDVDPGADTNRTVFTFVGAPDAVVDAAFAFYVETLKRVDMRKHSGAHPRMGAVDVCPFVPVSGVTMDDCADLARRLGQRVGAELGMPVYLYEAAASTEERKNLAVVRAGEYEGLERRFEAGELAPDYGAQVWSEDLARTGATAIGARPFLAAYNINLNTRSRSIAHNIALDLRERGRWVKDAQHRIARDEQGNKLRKDGLLPSVKAVGWYLDEFKRAQISMNLTNLEHCSLHKAFESACQRAEHYGVRVTGSELVGLVPRSAMIDAGRFYLDKQGRSLGVPEDDLVETAIQSLGLRELGPFDPRQKVVEYAVAAETPLADLTISGFVNETLRDSPAPGGGSVAALAGGLGAALAGMVANLTAASRKHRDARPRLSEIADRAAGLAARCVRAIDDDTAAFEAVLAARRSKDGSEAERELAVRKAMAAAIEVPLSVVEGAAEVVELASAVATEGLEAARSDAAVAARMARVAAEGAYDNVLINLPDFVGAGGSEDQRAAFVDRARAALTACRQRSDDVAEAIRTALESQAGL